MNREQAIQQQIDEIMDTFDFQAALKVLETYKTLDRGYPADWIVDGEFSESMVRQEARDCLKLAVKHGFCGTGYFAANLHEREDDDGPWVKVDLFFGDHAYNDGVSYEK